LLILETTNKAVYGILGLENTLNYNSYRKLDWLIKLLSKTE